MSLINEALKKAQKQRTGEAPSLSSLPSIGGERPVHIAKRRTPPGFDTLLLRLGVGVGVLVIVVVGGILLFRDKGTPAPTPPPPVAVAPAPSPTATSPTPAAPVQTAPSTQASTFVVPQATPPAAAPAKTVTVTATPKAETAPSVVAQTPAPVVEPPKPEPAKPPAAARKLEPRAINYIESIRVAGIRASATDSKVLMNDRVYRVGDTVEHEMGLKLVGITSSSLTFEDEQGGRYTRNF